MGEILPFQKRMQKAKAKKTKPKGIRVRRGKIAGLLTVNFIADMCGIDRARARKLFYRAVRSLKMDIKSLSARDVGKIVVYLSQKNLPLHKLF